VMIHDELKSIIPAIRRAKASSDSDFRLLISENSFSTDFDYLGVVGTFSWPVRQRYQEL
jgi:hypothetical protein